MESIIIKIPNFKLNIFQNLLKQSLLVDKQLMLEITPYMVKSCSFSPTKSFMKLWTTPLTNLIVKPEVIYSAESMVLESENNDVVFDFVPFNFYVLKGDLFSKYMSVHISDTVDLEFNIQVKNNKHQAASLKIFSKTEGNSPLATTLVLTTEDLITNKIDDYSQILNECSPSKNMTEFILTDKQMQEIKRLIKNLHKAVADNTAYLTFTIDGINKKINVNDKVFNIDFDCAFEALEQQISFNILKSDFLMTGNNSFSIFASTIDNKVIFGGKFANSLVWCLSTKISDSVMDFNSSVIESTIDSLEIEEYL